MIMCASDADLQAGKARRKLIAQSMEELHLKPSTCQGEGGGMLHKGRALLRLDAAGLEGFRRERGAATKLCRVCMGHHE
jgi:hypothetical protein